ncbi:MAG: FAD-binding oxidoreductase, partial [Desulfobacterales bacterium]
MTTPHVESIIPGTGGMTVQNPYLPYPVRIEEIITETEDRNLKTFKLVFLNTADEKKFAYKAGQFAELSITGKGEIPIGIASSPTEKGFLLFTVNRVGLVSTALHNMRVGDIMGVRGPMGNWYPWETIEGKSVVIIGGGFAFTTLRSSIVYMLDPNNRPKFKDIHVIYGARTPGMLLYRDELAAWEERDDI